MKPERIVVIEQMIENLSNDFDRHIMWIRAILEKERRGIMK